MKSYQYDEGVAGANGSDNYGQVAGYFEVAPSNLNHYDYAFVGYLHGASGQVAYLGPDILPLAINDSGEICGYGINGSGAEVGFLLTPIKRCF